MPITWLMGHTKPSNGKAYRVTPRMVLDSIREAGGKVQNGAPYERFPGQARWVEGAISRLISLALIERVRDVDLGFALVLK